MFTIYSNTTKMQKYYIILRNILKNYKKNIFVTFFRHIPVGATTEKMPQRKIAATNINTHRSDAKKQSEKYSKKRHNIYR